MYKGFNFCWRAVRTCWEYSWIEIDDRIVDPTLPHLNKNAQELCYLRRNG